MNLSAVIIAKNEEANIGRCLASLKDVCSDIVIIDDGSKDNTHEIARSYGARVIFEEWYGYAKNKNIGNRHALHPWILSIDADEVLSEDLKRSILRIDFEDCQCVYAIDRQTYYGNTPVRYSGWYPDWIVRIFHRDVAHWTGDFVHEKLEFSKSVSVRHLSGKLMHYSYKDEDDLLRRTEKYARLKAAAKINQGCRPNGIRTFFAAAWAAAKSYALQGGFMDGAIGWKIARMKAYGQVRRNQLMKELIHSSSENAED